jgi:hypothetical protein
LKTVTTTSDCCAIALNERFLEGHVPAQMTKSCLHLLDQAKAFSRMIDAVN